MMTAANLMYIGAYTRNEPHVQGAAQGIYTYQVDPESGALFYLGTTPGLENPTFLTVDRKERYLYAVSEVAEYEGTQSGSVAAYAIDEKGGLRLLNQQASHGIAPCHLCVGHDSSYLLLTNYGSGVVSMFPLSEDGSLKPATCVIQLQGSGINPQRQQGPHAHSINIDPAGRFAVAADLGTDKVMIYAIDGEHGQLTPAEQPWVDAEPGSGPRHFAFHPDRRHAYLIQEMGSMITLFDYEEARGSLKPVQTISTLPQDYTGDSTCADIHVHPSGRFLYGSNRGHDSIAIFEIDEENGRLTALGHESTRGKTPRNFVLDAVGHFLYAANQDTHTVETFSIDQTTGLLTHCHSAEAPSPVCLHIIGQG
jgi:6-phosphogluconolactonase